MTNKNEIFSLISDYQYSRYSALAEHRRNEGCVHSAMSHGNRPTQAAEDPTAQQ